MKRALAKLVLLGITALVCVVASECAVRLIVDPVNFLEPELLEDPVLRWRVEPGSAGHDAWGYRNSAVPDAVDLVAIGDSQTYGSGTPASESWPSWLGLETGRSVYSLAMNGYGPVDYLALVEEKALSLSPEHVVVGLYFGNDLVDAWRSVYTKEHWARLRDPTFTVTELPSESERVMPANRQPVGAGMALLGHVRGWIRQRSVLYRMLAVGIGDRLRGARLAATEDSDVAMSLVRDESGTLLTAADPRYRFQALDFENPRVPEGLRLSIAVLEEMARTTRAAGVGFTVLLIPTKIRVFEAEVAARPATRDAALIARLIANEERAAAEVTAQLEAEGIHVVSALDALRANRLEGIYPTGSDGHPNGAGYRIIATAVAEAIDPQR